MASNGRTGNAANLVYYGESKSGPDSGNYGVHTYDGMRSSKPGLLTVDAGLHGGNNGTGYTTSPYVYYYTIYLGYTTNTGDYDSQEYGVNKADGRRVYFTPSYSDNYYDRTSTGEIGRHRRWDGNHENYVGTGSNSFVAVGASRTNPDGNYYYYYNQWYFYDNDTGTNYHESAVANYNGVPIYSTAIYRENNDANKHVVKVGDEYFKLTVADTNDRGGYSLISSDFYTPATGTYKKGEMDFITDFDIGHRNGGGAVLDYVNNFYIDLGNYNNFFYMGYGSKENKDVWGKDADLFINAWGLPIIYEAMQDDTTGQDSYSQTTATTIGAGSNNWVNYDANTKNDSGRNSYFFLSHGATRGAAESFDRSNYDVDIGYQNGNNADMYVIAYGNEYTVVQYERLVFDTVDGYQSTVTTMVASNQDTVGILVDEYSPSYGSWTGDATERSGTYSVALLAPVASEPNQSTGETEAISNERNYTQGNYVDYLMTDGTTAALRVAIVPALYLAIVSLRALEPIHDLQRNYTNVSAVNYAVTPGDDSRELLNPWFYTDYPVETGSIVLTAYKEDVDGLYSNTGRLVVAETYRQSNPMGVQDTDWVAFTQETLSPYQAEAEAKQAEYEAAANDAANGDYEGMVTAAAAPYVAEVEAAYAEYEAILNEAGNEDYVAQVMDVVTPYQQDLENKQAEYEAAINDAANGDYEGMVMSVVGPTVEDAAGKQAEAEQLWAENDPTNPDNGGGEGGGNDLGVGSTQDFEDYVNGQAEYFLGEAAQGRPELPAQHTGSTDLAYNLQYIVDTEYFALDVTQWALDLSKEGLPELNEILPIVDQYISDPNALVAQLTEGLPINGVEEGIQATRDFFESQTSFAQEIQAVGEGQLDYVQEYVNRNTAYLGEFLVSKAGQYSISEFTEPVDMTMNEFMAADEGSPLRMLAEAYFEAL